MDARHFNGGRMSLNIISKRLMEISRRNLLRMAVVGGGAILIGYGLALHASIMIKEMIAKISLE